MKTIHEKAVKLACEFEMEPDYTVKFHEKRKLWSVIDMDNDVELYTDSQFIKEFADMYEAVTKC